MLSDEAAASPDASSATWQAWTGTAWAAQPALTCTVATAAELSAAQAARASAALRAKEEQRARAAAAREASVQAVRLAAGSCPSSTGSGLASISVCCVSSAGSCLSSTGSCLASISGCCVSSAGSGLASISGCCVSSVASCASAANSCPSGCCVCTEQGYVRLHPPEQVKHFRGPCAACCKPLAPCCCVSADGEAIFGCVPTDRGYFLPACLHMALCPQLGCDPRGGFEYFDFCEPMGNEGCFVSFFSTLFFCCLQGGSVLW